MAFAVRCGTDLIAVARVAQAAERLGQPFLDRIFTAAEQADCFPDGRYTAVGWTSLAARFAAKEAAAKALGTGIGPRGVRWTDIAVVKPNGATPQIELAGAARAVFEESGGSSISLSLAHDAGLAQAFCVILLNLDHACGQTMAAIHPDL